MSQSLIDDQDLSKVTYTGTWIRGGTHHEHNSTVVSSTSVGDSFTVSFKGTSISVYGTIDATSDGVITKYSIDGTPAVQMTSQAGSGDAATYRQEFWNSDPLSFNDHDLTVTMVKVNGNQAAGEGTVWFDFFAVTSPTSAAHSTSGKENHMGAIIGGVIGGVACLLAIVAFLLYYWHRRKTATARSKSEFGDSPPVLDIRGIPDNGSAGIQPFLIGFGDAFNSSSGTTNVTRSRENLSPIKIPIHPRPAGDSHKFSSTGPPSTVTAIPSASSSSNALSSPMSTRVKVPPITIPPDTSQRAPEELVQHVDSGIRTADPAHVDIPAAKVELPPIYTPV